MKDSIGNLIAVLFLSREITHREHLKTKSYAQHVALGSFYEDIIPLADSLVETYQGKTGTLVDIPYLSGNTKEDIVTVLKKLLGKVEEDRKTCCPEDSTIQNIIDETIALYLSTIYKLTFLK